MYIEKKDGLTLYLANAQTTARLTCAYVMHQVIHGMFGTRSDVEFMNAVLMKRIDRDLIHKVNIIEMDFLHPLFVQKILDCNAFYCQCEHANGNANVNVNMNMNMNEKDYAEEEEDECECDECESESNTIELFYNQWPLELNGGGNDGAHDAGADVAAIELLTV